jgi:phage tail-like protein
MNARLTQDGDLPLGNMRFRVAIDGIGGAAAHQVVFPEARLVAGRSGKTGGVAFGPLILRRALTASRDWYEWWEAARRERDPQRRALRVMLLDAAGREARDWRFEGAVPVAYQLSPLDALGAAAAFETLELAIADFVDVGAGQRPGQRARVRRAR